MNPESDSPSHPELEARITAWLLGELSTEETDEVRRAVEGNPQFAILHRRLEQTVGLLRQSERHAEAPERELKLSEERRQKLLERFRVIAAVEFVPPKESRLSWMLPLAAAAVMILICWAAALQTLSPRLASFTFAKSRAARTFAAGVPESLLVEKSGVPAAPASTPIPSVAREDVPASASRPQESVGKPEGLESIPPPADFEERLRLARVMEGVDASGPRPAWVRETLLKGGETSTDNDRSLARGSIYLPPAAEGNEKAPAMPAEAAKLRGMGEMDVAGNGLLGRFGYEVDRGTAAQTPPQNSPGLASSTDLARKNVDDKGSLGYFKPDTQPSGVGGQNGDVRFDLESERRGEKVEGKQVDALAVPQFSVQANRNEILRERFVEKKSDLALAATPSGSMAGGVGGGGGAARADNKPSKLPVLGDIPLAGAMFTSEAGGKPAQEVGGAYAPSGAGVAGDTSRQIIVNADAESISSKRAEAVVVVDAASGLADGLGISGRLEPGQVAGATPVELKLQAGTQSAESADGQRPLREDTRMMARYGLAPRGFKLNLENNSIRESKDRDLATLEQKEEVAQKVKGAANQEADVKLAKRVEMDKSAAVVAGRVVARAPELPAIRRPVPSLEPQPEVQTKENPFSTFSLNVSDVSFKLAAASLEKGVSPDPATVRGEEFVNALDYRDPEPGPGLRVGFNWERARYPFAHNRDLIRLAIKTASRGREAGRPLRLVLLLDNSGSMERADRVVIIREALRVLGAQLQPQDEVSVVAFARTARLWVDGMPGSRAGELVNRVGNLTPEGGTNLEDALNLAYQTALRHFLAQGNNRVVLLTDGAANLGEVDPEALKRKVESYRQRGIALDCFGIGWEDYNDDLLEVLSRNGDGRYGFVNRPEEAASEFAGQLAGSLQAAASDVKVQVEFNPQRVSAYRQIGYAKHQLTKEQFRDNTVNAAQLGAAEAGNALYVIETQPQGEGDIGWVRVRYRLPGTDDYREQEWVIPFTGTALPLGNASPAMRMAAVACAFSEWLVGSPFAGEVTADSLLEYLAGVPDAFSPDPRPKQLEWMIRQAKSISNH